MAQHDRDSAQATFEGDQFMTDGGKDPLADVECDLDTILGTHTYRGNLYSTGEADEKVPVNVLTGEKARDVPSVEYAKAVADKHTNEGKSQRVAVVQSTESMVESQSGPFVTTVFYNSKVVRGRVVGEGEFGLPEYEYEGHKRMKGYRTLMHDSEEYEVRLDDVDYEANEVTITVEEVGA